MATKTNHRITKKSLLDIHAKLIVLILELQRTEEVENLDQLRDQFKYNLKQCENLASASGYHAREIEMVQFALIAFLDETVNVSNWHNRLSWLNEPLQVEIYKRRTAGVAFFERLATLRKKPAKYRHLIEIYYLCILLGFKGKYDEDKTNQLETLRKNIEQDLFGKTGRTTNLLSPNGLPGKKNKTPDGRIPIWLIFAITFGIAIILFAFINSSVTEKAVKTQKSIEAIH